MIVILAQGYSSCSVLEVMLSDIKAAKRKIRTYSSMVDLKLVQRIELVELKNEYPFKTYPYVYHYGKWSWKKPEMAKRYSSFCKLLHGTTDQDGCTLVRSRKVLNGLFGSNS